MAPLVSVVVPVYNVEPYLADCLESISAQTLDDLEVVVVDDGSTDGGPDIAAAFAQRDSRFRLIRQPNGGLGCARNTGTRHATGTFLTFVDSDDLVSCDAYELLTRTLRETGSAFASGNVHLFTSNGTSQSPMHRRPLGRTRLRTHITKDRLLVYDRLAPNKMFRRDFWDEHGFAFPEGVLYEDIPVTLPAHFLAHSVDVLHEPVYYWRQREEGELSITQRRAEVRAVTDRFAAVRTVSRFLADRGRHYREHKRWYDEVALRSDLRIFLDILPEADDEFRQRFLGLTREFLEQVDRRLLGKLPPVKRLEWYLAREGRLAELLDLQRFERNGDTAPVIRRWGRRYIGYPYWSDGTIPRRLYRATPSVELRSQIDAVTWHRGKLRVTGHAYMTSRGLGWPWSAVKVIGLRGTATGRTLLVPVRNRRTPEVTARSRQSAYSYDWAGFSFTLDPKRLRTRGQWQDGTWKVAVGVARGRLLRRSLLRAPASGSGAYPPYQYVDDAVRVIPTTFEGTLRIKIETVRARVTSCCATEDGVDIEGVLSWNGESPPNGMLHVSRVAGVPVRSYPIAFEDAGEGRFAFRASVPMADLREECAADARRLSGQVDDSVNWRVDIDAGDGPIRVVADEGLATAKHAAGDQVLLAHRTPGGYLWLTLRSVRPVVTDWRWQPDGVLLLEGTWPLPSASRAELVLCGRDRRQEIGFPLARTGATFGVEIAATAVTSPAGTLPIRSGVWDVLFRVREANCDGPPAQAAVKVAHEVAGRLPTAAEVDGRRYLLADNHYDRLVLEVSSDLRPEERGPRAQRRLRRRMYRVGRLRGLRDAVLFDSYTGKQYSDSPRAIHEELVSRGSDLDLLWAVRDRQVALPGTASPLRLWGAEWYEAFARCRYIVTNAHLPAWFRSRPGQVVVQTWHGTPLKRIGFDIEDVQFANAGYLAKLAREVPNWSYLVSPNRFSTPILRRAFRYDGELIETGYPRNDILYRPDAPVVAAAVRDRLGLSPDRRVVLYAPTWRDDQFYGPGRYKLDLRLDLARARQALGGECALLVRAHPNVVDSVPGAGDGFVWDVTAYPDVAELMLVADVLVTDYSSLIFDFAGTGRPMIFFTYDLEHYRDALRGFYFAFEQDAPGPLLQTSDEVIDALADLDGLTRAYRDSRDRFVDRFCELDDGKAAGRVVDRVFGA